MKATLNFDPNSLLQGCEERRVRILATVKSSHDVRYVMTRTHVHAHNLHNGCLCAGQSVLTLHRVSGCCHVGTDLVHQNWGSWLLLELLKYVEWCLCVCVCGGGGGGGGGGGEWDTGQTHS